jgi:ABC-2 type transport system permease protein
MTSTGTVFDTGYQRYAGAREGRRRSRLGIYKDGVRIALGLGRGGRAKILPFFFIAVLAVIGAVMAIIAGAVDMLGGPGASQDLDLPTHSDYYGVASMIVFVFAAVVAPELLCRDKRDGVISLYLVRPVTGSDYIMSRWLAFFTVMLVALWLPQMVLFFGFSMASPDPVKYIGDHWLDVPRFLTSGAAMAAYSTTLALLTASFTSRRAYASVFLVGLLVITTPFTVGLSQEIGGNLGRWISMFTLSSIPLHVNDVLFGGPSEMTDRAPAREFGSTALVVWFFVCTIVPGLVLWARYRRLTP